MFNRILDDLTLSSDIAGNVFRNIRGDGYNGDRSFVATLRALLHPRIGDDVVRMNLTSSNFGRSGMRGVDSKTLIGASVGDLREGRLQIHNVSASDSEDRKAFFDILDSTDTGFLKLFNNYHEMTNIREFVAPAMNARFYTSEEKKNTVIFVESMNTMKWHYIQSFCPRYFKWYFESSPISEEEKSLLQSLVKRSSDDYERIIEEIASKFDMRSYLIESMVGDLERGARRQQLDRIDQNISEVRAKLERYMSQYRDALSNLDDLNVRRIGLVDIINSDVSGESELVDYLKSNKNIDVIGASGSRFEFIVRSYLDYWDQDIFDSAINRKTSSLYTGYGVRNHAFSDADTRKKFLSAIFSETPLLRIKMCGYYNLDIHGDSTSSRGYSYPKNCKDRLPNPHLHRFNCLGNHQIAINEYLRNGDTVGAVEQCVGSCKSINLAEAPTFTYFFEMLFSTNENVIELPDHTSVSPTEALKWLNERDGNTTTEA